MDLLIFDLDGTLIDSKLDLVHSVNAARQEMGLPSLSAETISSYIGNGAQVLMERALGPEAPPAEVAHALAFFLQHYRAHKLDHTRLYPGVRNALDRFHAKQICMAVLTNKPVRISQEIVNELDLQAHFSYVYGGNSFPFKKPHPIGIQTLISDCGVQPDRVLMVGDSAVDIHTARNAGVTACGVTYGFQPETFRAHPPDFLVDSLEELADRIMAS